MVHKRNQTDALIVGGGPVGSYAALSLAKLGVEATVFEEHSTIGQPSHCAGHLSIRSLKSLKLYPLPKGIVENTFNAANFYSPKGTKLTLRLSGPVTAALDRARFDQFLAEQAQAAGANFIMDSRVNSLLLMDGFVKGVKATGKDGAEGVVHAKVVLDAEGISSRLLRQTGLSALRPKGLVYAVEAEVEGVQGVECDAVEVYFGKDYAPGFYGWVIPRLDGTAKIGLATNTGNPREYLKRLMFKHPVASKQLEKARITKIGYHAITLGGPISRSYANGFLAAGDCASQVKPTTGGGVIFGLTCARTAANVVSEALKRDNVSANFLQTYQTQYENILNFDFSVMLRLRQFLNFITDEKFDDMLRVCRRLGVDRALSDVDEIDFQGRLLLTLLRKPSMLAALTYFGLLYLSTKT